MTGLTARRKLSITGKIGGEKRVPLTSASGYAGMSPSPQAFAQGFRSKTQGLSAGQTQLEATIRPDVHHFARSQVGYSAGTIGNEGQTKTKSGIHEFRKTERVPHMSYDLDGDGTVSQRDYFLASQFDHDRDGMLNERELAAAKAAIAMTEAGQLTLRSVMKLEKDEPNPYSRAGKMTRSYMLERRKGEFTEEREQSLRERIEKDKAEHVRFAQTMGGRYPWISQTGPDWGSSMDLDKIASMHQDTRAKLDGTNKQSQYGIDTYGPPNKGQGMDLDIQEWRTRRKHHIKPVASKHAQVLAHSDTSVASTFARTFHNVLGNRTKSSMDWQPGFPAGSAARTQLESINNDKTRHWITRDEQHDPWFTHGRPQTSRVHNETQKLHLSNVNTNRRGSSSRDGSQTARVGTQREIWEKKYLNKTGILRTVPGTVGLEYGTPRGREADPHAVAAGVKSGIRGGTGPKPIQFTAAFQNGNELIHPIVNESKFLYKKFT